VYVTVTAAGVQIGAADDCTSLDVRTAPALRSSLDETLRQARLGHWDGGDEADLQVAELRRRAAAEGVPADWARRWDDMIAYATRRGWLSPDGTTVRAHITDLPDLPDPRSRNPNPAASAGRTASVAGPSPSIGAWVPGPRTQPYECGASVAPSNSWCTGDPAAPARMG
jgi:hypothetical protein